MENKIEFMSLYEYLGKPAGGELGKLVYDKAKELKQPVETREVSTRTYTGKVIIYPREFLDSYFNNQNSSTSSSEEINFDIDDYSPFQ